MTDFTGIKKTVEAKHRYLEAYVDDGTISGAAKAAGVSRQCYYEWLKDDPKFADAAEKAREDAIESLEREARRRAKARSDILLIFLLKAARPDVYAERSKVESTELVRIVDDSRG